MKDDEKIILSFDMDFTLIDNREGIINSFKYALKKKRLPDMDDLELERTIVVRLLGVCDLVVFSALRIDLVDLLAFSRSVMI